MQQEWHRAVLSSTLALEHRSLWLAGQYLMQAIICRKTEEESARTFRLSEMGNSMQPHETERRREVAQLVSGAKRVIEKRGIVRSTLREVLRRLEKLAAKQYLWSTSAYPNPKQSRQSILYSISEEEDRGFALYMHVACPRRIVPPHNYATWACIAAIEGCEDNYFYKSERRVSADGKSHIRPTGFIAVRPGSGTVLMPKDIRAVGNSGESFGRHLYFCGQAVETLTSPLQYGLASHTAKVMPPAMAVRL